MWSVGVVMFVMLCAFPPDFDETAAGLAVEFPSPYWDHVSSAAKDLIQRLLVSDPARRLTLRREERRRKLFRNVRSNSDSSNK